MAINTLALAEKMTGELDKAVVQKAVTGLFADNAMRAKFVGAATVLIPNMDFYGLGDYDRDNGFAQGSITVANESYELTMDRGRTFQLDAQDCDETGIPSLAGQVMGEFVRTKVVPEMDAYCLSKLAKVATDAKQTPTATTLVNKSYAIFTEATNAALSNMGYDEEFVAFVNPAFYADLMSTTEVTRAITVQNFKKGEIDFKVKAINGVPVFPVSDSRMKDTYTFYDGVTSSGTDQRPGGFVPGASAKDVGLLVVPKRAASLVKKTEKIRVFSPDVNQTHDAWKFDYRLYYDIFVRKSMESGIYAYVYGGE